MSEQEILSKAIQKVIDGGYNETIGNKLLRVLPSFFEIDTPDSVLARDQWIRGVIFDHNFAKYLFGEETERLWECPKCGYSFQYYKHNETQEYCPNDGRKVVDITKPISKWEQPWLRHLQEMVAEDEPIEYIRDFLENKNADN